MSEPDVASDDRVQERDNAEARTQSVPPPVAVPPDGYGARLAWERQRAGLSVADVAASLRLHPNQVRAIEQEDLTRLPEPAYVRGFIRSYARVLNVDAAPMLADLSAKLNPSPASVIDAMTTTRDYSPVRAAARERMSRQLVIGAAVFGLIALGFIGWLSTQRGKAMATPQVAASPARAQSASSPIVESATTNREETAPTTAAALATEDGVSAVTAEAVAGSSAQPPMLLLRFSGRSWVEVTDASGKILLSELISAGAERELNGAAPLTVVIGDANVTAVDVHGEAFNLQPFTRNNVARFTVRAQ